MEFPRRAPNQDPVSPDCRSAAPKVRTAAANATSSGAPADLLDRYAPTTIGRQTRRWSDRLLLTPTTAHQFGANGAGIRSPGKVPEDRPRHARERNICVPER